MRYALCPTHVLTACGKHMILLWLLLLAACTDIYSPDIERVDRYLVVEGLVTDQPGPHLVKLTRSSTFGEPFPRIMVTGAHVFISASGGDTITLEEHAAGHYYTPESFSGITGARYVLHIHTAEGQTYRSESQLMMPPVTVEAVEAEFGYKPFFQYSGVSRTIIRENLLGGKIFITVGGEESPMFRFTSNLLVDYYIVYPGIFPTVDNCWIRRSVLDYIDSDVGRGHGTGITGLHMISFIPARPHNLPFLGFPNYVTGPENIFYGSLRILTSRIFALNEEAYDFHYMRNKQLSSEGRFFDPIAAQLPGNIMRIDHPGEPVLGLFEVSAVSSASILVKISPIEIASALINLVDTIPDTGCMNEEIPGFIRDLPVLK